MVTCVAHNHKTENDFGGSIPSLATNFKNMKKIIMVNWCLESNFSSVENFKNYILQ